MLERIKLFVQNASEEMPYLFVNVEPLHSYISPVAKFCSFVNCLNLGFFQGRVFPFLSEGMVWDTS